MNGENLALLASDDLHCGSCGHVKHIGWCAERNGRHQCSCHRLITDYRDE